MVIGAGDVVLHLWSSMGAVGVAIFDEPAHLATAIICLAALGWPGGRALWMATLVSSVALDLDHIPQFLGTQILTQGTTRPYTHSLLTLLVVGVLAWRCRGRGRQLALGALLGLACHLFRDMGEPTGQRGVPLVWPLSDAGFRLPYLIYAAAMATLALVAVARIRRDTAHASGAVATTGPSRRQGGRGGQEPVE